MKPTYISGDFNQSTFPYGGRLVCGTSGLGGVWGEVDPEESVRAILYALEAGVRAFDTAPSYADAEAFLGKALRIWKGEKPFVSTKVGRLRGESAFDCKTDHSPKRMEQSLYESLATLGLQKVDLVFLHEPELVPLREMDNILTMLHDFKTKGLCDFIGIGGNPSNEFRPFIKKENFDALSGFLKMNACNLTAFQKDIPQIKAEGLWYVAASPLHFGLLGNRFNQYIADTKKPDWLSPSDVENAINLKTLAEKENLALSELAFRYLLSIKEADRVVIGASDLIQMKASLNSWQKGKLPEALFDTVTNINFSAD